ncbi:uncharacterized protein LOC135400331 [Ornithodoros turicata]|uniref:uncharacterized protein LOC135400331 n=1 Tax=Ornithodoros turicata TaxID=34597 RepID=UPI00313A4103
MVAMFPLQKRLASVAKVTGSLQNESIACSWTVLLMAAFVNKDGGRLRSAMSAQHLVCSSLLLALLVADVALSPTLGARLGPRLSTTPKNVDLAELWKRMALLPHSRTGSSMPSLSIVGPLDALRNQIARDMALRMRTATAQKNQQILDRIGKRSMPTFNDEEASALLTFPKQQQQRVDQSAFSSQESYSEELV